MPAAHLVGRETAVRGSPVTVPCRRHAGTTGRGLGGSSIVRDVGGDPADVRDRQIATDGRFLTLVGLRTQAAVVALATEPRGRPGPDRIGRSVDDLLASAPLPWHRRRARQLVAGMVSAYFKLFSPPSVWRLVDAERALGAGRVDLWWESGAGRIVIDELKASRGQDWPDPADEAQVCGYAEAGRRALGSRLIAVRLLVLGPPSRGFLFDPASLTSAPKRIVPSTSDGRSEWPWNVGETRGEPTR